MKKYVIIFIAGILLVPLAFYLYLQSGYAPVSTSASPLPFERFFAKLAMRATLGRELPKSSGGPPTESDLIKGARIYHQNCAICHGLPNESRSAISKGMYPHPPQFFRPGRSTAYNPNRPFRPATPKAYWKIKNGVRLTGMPGFKDSFTEQQILAVSQFVGNARNLPPAAIAALEGRHQEAAQSDSSAKETPHPASKSR